MSVTFANARSFLAADSFRCRNRVSLRTIFPSLYLAALWYSIILVYDLFLRSTLHDAYFLHFLSYPIRTSPPRRRSAILASFSSTLRNSTRKRQLRYRPSSIHMIHTCIGVHVRTVCMHTYVLIYLMRWRLTILSRRGARFDKGQNDKGTDEKIPTCNSRSDKIFAKKEGFIKLFYSCEKVWNGTLIFDACSMLLETWI